MKDWLYFNGTNVTFYVRMSKFFNKKRFFIKEKVGKEVNIKAYNENGWFFIKCSLLDESNGSDDLLFYVRYPYVQNKRLQVSFNIPDEPISKFNLPVYPDTVMEKLKSTEHNSHYYDNNIGFEIMSDTNKIGKEKLCVTVDEYFTKAQAKHTWKYIKRNNYVSRFKWDSYMKTYDCYCNACKVDDGKNKFVSWVSVPDVGFVRRAGFKVRGDNHIFKYKGKLYEPVEAKCYERLVFMNRTEYNEFIRNTGDKGTQRFDTIWKMGLSDEDIENNGNIIGGAWRTLNGKVYGNKTLKDIPTNAEMVVTLGYHKTQVGDAIRCPVCDELNNIICYSDYNPLPLIYRLKEYLMSIPMMAHFLKTNEVQKWKKKNM